MQTLQGALRLLFSCGLNLQRNFLAHVRSHKAKHKVEWTFVRGSRWEWKTLVETLKPGVTLEVLDVWSPLWSCDEIFFESEVFEEESGVTPERFGQL